MRGLSKNDKEWGRRMGLLIFILVCVSAICVYFDAERIGAERGLIGGLGDLSPVGWAIATLGVWIIAFPAYLIYRPQIKRAVARAAEHRRPVDISGWAARTSPEVDASSGAAPPGIEARELYADHLGGSSSTAHYIEQFQRWDAAGKGSYSWNWAAFLAGGWWLAYRRMYGAAAAYPIIILVVAVLGSVLLPPSLWLVFVLLVPAAGLAMVADRLLYARVKSRIDPSLRNTGMNQSRVIQGVSEPPTSWRAVGVYAVIVFIVSSIAAGLLVKLQTPLSDTALFSKGVAYLNGQGVPQDDAKAFAYFRRAATDNYDPAQYDLGFMYANGRGVARDDSHAVAWFSRAAGDGYAPAQTSLGFMYANGRGVPRDVGQAISLYRQAAEQGYALAQFSLALMYAKGQGVTKDDALAVAWMQKAADQGFAPAKNALDRLHRETGVAPAD